ncbi:MAG: fatty acid desaturase family protein [Alphaproteobacteria bacterium]|nr:fatty acid desaturase family protein [Alphaproteobacteria bacterium]
MITPSDYLSAEEISRLRAKSQWRSVWMVAHVWGVVFGAMALFALWPNPLTFILAVMLIGARQLGMAILVHDAAHGALFHNRALNDRVSNWLLGYPVLTETKAYRVYHLEHHKYVQQPNDPDIGLSAPFPITKSSFRRKLWRDITGRTGFKQRGAQIRAAIGAPDMPLASRIALFRRKMGGMLITNLVLLGGLSAIGYWYLYPLLWVLPLLTYYQVITRVRNIAEHAVVPDNDDDFRTARTTRANWLMRVSLAPYFVNYHLEHHLMMFVPCYRLPQVRELFLAKGHGARMEYKPDYRSVLALAISKPEPAADANATGRTAA